MDHEKGTFGGLSTSLKAELEPQHADLLLFACCLTSGLVDRNTIFVGLGASHQNLRPYGWARSLTSIGCFILGSFLFARLHRVLGTRQRVSLMLSFLLQASIILLTAGLVQGGAVSSTLAGKGSQTAPPWDQEVPIILLSIQSAGQIVASRALGYNEIPTVVITSLLCDLMSDPQLFLIRNVKRDRRIIAFVLTLVGAIVGGWVTKVTGGLLPFSGCQLVSKACLS
ncbi:hypothetical protein N7449_009885 [Penicillium cf. viridicatum]|uniref:DUF1275 domain protein n=1 Tax=Penicillium cf. viridicatum TaxID=2972119 RepID=A0A9W9J0D3_9EURO|nr:hypothetical protein N7449_009885 [Penicillium cf. viridicatum]